MMTVGEVALQGYHTTRAVMACTQLGQTFDAF